MLSFRFILSLLLSGIVLSSCRSYTRPASSTTIKPDLTVVGVVVPENRFASTRICAVTHFTVECLPAIGFTQKPGPDLTLYDQGAYQGRQTVSDLQTPAGNQFGITLSYQAVKTVEIAGKLTFPKLKAAPGEEGLYFVLLFRTPTGYRDFKTAEENGNSSLDQDPENGFIPNFWTRLPSAGDQKHIKMPTQGRRISRPFFIWNLEVKKEGEAYQTEAAQIRVSPLPFFDK